MNNKEFISQLALKMGYSGVKTQRVVNQLLSVMGDSLQEGNYISVSNFGSFEVKKKLERIIVNPATGQRMLVPPKLVLGFKPSPNWKTRMKNTSENNQQEDTNG